MCMNKYDNNGILVHPMKNRTATEITNTFTFYMKASVEQVYNLDSKN